MFIVRWRHFQNGVTHGVEGYFSVICNICDMWCVMWCVTCDVWCDMSYDMYYSPMLMLWWRHFQNGVTHRVQWYFSVICNICDMWCVTCDVWHEMCDMWCVIWHVLWHVLPSHVDVRVETFPKGCHIWGPVLFFQWFLTSVTCDVWHVMCDV